MQVPMIHSNGTSPDVLIELLCHAKEAVNNALEALKVTAPNGRDYYPLGPEAMDRARREHMERMRKIESVRLELDELSMAIAEARDQ